MNRKELTKSFMMISNLKKSLFSMVYSKICKRCYGALFNIQGGGARVFVSWKLFISSRLGGALKNSNFITRLYRTVLEVNYLFQSARHYLFQKNSNPPLENEWCPTPPPPPPRVSILTVHSGETVTSLTGILSVTLRVVVYIYTCYWMFISLK